MCLCWMCAVKRIEIVWAILATRASGDFTGNRRVCRSGMQQTSCSELMIYAIHLNDSDIPASPRSHVRLQSNINFTDSAVSYHRAPGRSV